MRSFKYIRECGPNFVIFACLELIMNPELTPTDNLIVPKVIEALNAAIGDVNSRYGISRKISSSVWINILLEHLSSTGKSLAYDVSSLVGDVNSSWQYAMIWKDNSTGDSPLVVECAWSREYLDIRDMFEKLLRANSRLRLIITYGGESDKDKERSLVSIVKLKKHVEFSGLSEKGECFLFATIMRDSNSKYGFEYEYVEKQ